MEPEFNPELQDDYIRYLDRLFEFQETRQSTLDNKMTQVLGQTGVVFTLITIFAPFLYGNLEGYSTCVKWLFFGVFIAALICFITSILFASKTLNVKNYNYMVGNVSTIKKDHKDKSDFIDEEINDLIMSVEYNINTNNSKGDSLITSQKFFTYGIGIISLLVVLLFVIPN